jgi:hypothetical protein
MKVKSSDFATLYNEAHASMLKFLDFLDEEQHSNAQGIRELDEVKLRTLSKEVILKVQEMASIQEATEKRRGLRVLN